MTHQLESDLLNVLTIGALGPVDLAHAAASDQLKQAVGPDPRPRRAASIERCLFGERRESGLVEHRIGAIDLSEQRFDLRTQSRITVGKSIERRGAVLGRQIQHGIQCRLHSRPFEAGLQVIRHHSIHHPAHPDRVRAHAAARLAP